MSSIEECPFCDLKDRILKENTHAHLFLSNPRKVEGHFLVAPKRHVERPWDLNERERIDIFELVFLTQELLVARFGGGCDVRQNFRPFIPQGQIKIDHVHYHIYPRQLEDPLYQLVEKHETAMFTDLTPEEKNRFSRLVQD